MGRVVVTLHQNHVIKDFVIPTAALESVLKVYDALMSHSIPHTVSVRSLEVSACWSWFWLPGVSSYLTG
jgi:hypothetical protein